MSLNNLTIRRRRRKPNVRQSSIFDPEFPNDPPPPHLAQVQSCGKFVRHRTLTEQLNAEIEPAKPAYDCGGLGCGFQPCNCNAPAKAREPVKPASSVMRDTARAILKE